MGTNNETPPTDPEAPVTPDMASGAAPVKRKPGRPRKHPLPPQTQAAPNASNEDDSIKRLDELKNGVFDRASRTNLIEEICSIEEAPKMAPQPPAAAPAVVTPSPKPSKRDLLLTAEENRARQMREQKPALEYILAHTVKRAPVLIGVRARSKTAPAKGGGAGTERPTLVAMLATDGAITERELGTPNAEMDFARGTYPIEWRLATPEETATILTKDDKKVIASSSLPFLDRHITEVKRGEAKKRFGEEALGAFPVNQKTFFLLPSLFDGFRPLAGDRMLIPYGGEGDYFAVASFGMIPENKRDTHKSSVMRCTPGTLKQTRESAIEAGTVPAGKKIDLKDADHILLAQLLANPGDAPLQMMTHELRVLTELRAACQAWLRTQEWRKKIIQFAGRQAKNRAYLEVGYDQPLVNMEAIVGESLRTQTIDAIIAQEEAAKKRMAECLEQIPFAAVLLDVPQVGASIAGSMLSALNNLERFRKDEYDPHAEIAKLVERIGRNFIRLGFKETIGGPTLPSILAEVEAISLDSLPEKSDLWHMRHHVVYPAGNAKAGQVRTWNCLHLLLSKWENEAAAFRVRSPDMVLLEEVSRSSIQDAEPTQKKRGRPSKKRAVMLDSAGTQTDLSEHQKIEQRIELARWTIILLKRKHRLEWSLRKYGVEGMRARKMIEAVQKFMGVFVVTSTTTPTGERIPLPPDRWHFARRERGVIGGFSPLARQAAFNLFTQAMKDCNSKKGLFGPMRKGLALVWLAYKRRHPKVETITRGNAPFDKYTPKGCLDAARWQFLGKFIDWTVRAYLAFTAGQAIPEHFHIGIIREAEVYYAEAPGVLARAFAFQSTPADLAWKLGDPPPPDLVPTTSEDDEPTALNQDAPAT
ncbi:hypothetical protein KBB27_00880 [Patescibacteria group bacterium]|nr:hypothetical protein [Patescibacteria group bacterium]